MFEIQKRVGLLVGSLVGITAYLTIVVFTELDFNWFGLLGSIIKELV